MAPVKIEWKSYRLRLRGMLQLARGPELTHREGVLLRVLFDDGCVGFGDAAPLPGWSRESLEDVLAALHARRSPTGLPSLEFALDSARRAWEPGRPKKTVPLCALHLEGGPPPPTRASVLKMKLAGQLDAALAGLRAIGERLAPGQRLRLDGNRRFSFDDALRIAEACEGLPVEFIEDPTSETRKLSEWPARTAVPLAVDETLRELGPAHPACQAAAVFVIKPTLTGGWQACLDLAGWGKSVVISSCFESIVGIHALGELAAAMPGPPMAAGLDTHAFLLEGLMTKPPLRDHVFLAGEPPPPVVWDELAG